MDSRGSSSGTSARAAGEPAVRRFVASAGGAPRWRQSLTLRTRAEAPERDETILLDSFDRRLRKAGLELRARGQAPHVVCRLCGQTQSPSEVELARLPRFAWDFPRALALELVHALEARGVEPVARHELELERWAVLDDQEKVVAWIDEEHHRVRSSGERDGGVPILCLALRGVRGYAREFQELARALARVEGLRPSKTRSFDALGLLGDAAREPGAWPKLDRRASAWRALGRIARAQLEVFEANGPRIRPGADAEHLHDARIALRRLRSLLGQLKGVLAPDLRAELLSELRWLAGCLGPARDLDVLLLELRLAEMRADLEPALEHLERERELAYAALVRELESERCTALRARLASVLDGKARSAGAGPLSEQPFAELVAKRLRRRLEEVVAQAAHADARAPSEELHELRIACKKLRYLLECCRGLVPREDLALAFADLKGLQSVLGTIQDSRVQSELLASLTGAIFAAIGARASLALGRFQEQTLQRGRAACARYVELRDAFLSPAGEMRFRRLFGDLARGAHAR